MRGKLSGSNNHKNTWWPMRILPTGAALLLACCLAAGIARADVLDEARELVRQGRAEQAYLRLEPLEAGRAGDIDFDYLLGVAALDAGRYDRAVIAFERVLATSPGFNSARFDLGRAYFAMGADDLAKQEFERLLQARPTAEGERAIRDFLDAIEQRRKGPRRRVTAYLEVGGGHDSNLSSTTPDFTNAINAAFSLPNVLPTGNSVLHSSPFGAVSGGVGASLPIPRGLEIVASLDARARHYQRNSEFDYSLLDGSLGVAWKREAASVQLSALGQAFRQDGATPAPMEGERPTSDRNATGANLEWRQAIDKGYEVFAVGQYLRLRYPTNAVQDTDQAYANLGLVHAFQGRWPGLVLVSAFYSRDRAKRPLDPEMPAVDVGRHSVGARGYAQCGLPSGAYAYALGSYSRRTDDSAGARAATVEIGRDRLLEASAGLVYPRGPWSLRASVSYVKNKSNIALYEFDKTEGGLGVRYEFR